MISKKKLEKKRKFFNTDFQKIILFNKQIKYYEISFIFEFFNKIKSFELQKNEKYRLDENLNILKTIDEISYFKNFPNFSEYLEFSIHNNIKTIKYRNQIKNFNLEENLKNISKIEFFEKKNLSILHSKKKQKIYLIRKKDLINLQNKSTLSIERKKNFFKKIFPISKFEIKYEYLLKNIKTKIFNINKKIFSEKKKKKKIYNIQFGKVLIKKNNKPILLLTKGSWVGEYEFMKNIENRVFEAVVKSSKCIVYEFNFDFLKKFFLCNPIEVKDFSFITNLKYSFNNKNKNLKKKTKNVFCDKLLSKFKEIKNEKKEIVKFLKKNHSERKWTEDDFFKPQENSVKNRNYYRCKLFSIQNKKKEKEIKKRKFFFQLDFKKIENLKSLIKKPFFKSNYINKKSGFLSRIKHKKNSNNYSNSKFINKFILKKSFSPKNLLKRNNGFILNNNKILTKTFDKNKIKTKHILNLEI